MLMVFKPTAEPRWPATRPSIKSENLSGESAGHFQNEFAITSLTFWFQLRCFTVHTPACPVFGKANATAKAFPLHLPFSSIFLTLSRLFWHGGIDGINIETELAKTSVLAGCHGIWWCPLQSRFVCNMEAKGHVGLLSLMLNEDRWGIRQQLGTKEASAA